MKYTMIDGNRNGTVTLYCYFNDQVVFEETYSSLTEAQDRAKVFLDSKLAMATYEPA